jgi:hypothetical protein
MGGRKNGKTRVSRPSASTTAVSQRKAATVACRAVLQTTELLEKIMLELHWFQTFVAQRVCRHWRAVIQDSAQIQEVRFRTTSSSPSLVWTLKDASLEISVIRCAAPIYEYKYLQQLTMTAALNPLALRLLKTTRSERSALAKYEFFDTVKKPAHKEVPPFFRFGTSAREMQITSPPTLRLSLVCSKKIVKSSRFGYMREKVLVENQEGVTVGDLCYTLANHWLKCHNCAIGKYLNGGGYVEFMLGWKTGKESLAKREIDVR